ncbi:MAG TPA: hypothetical protein VNL77_18655 [Roseiflexaceae bacterium]|nr:hypothetical protein [Roseiflexaceae bacterium]
MITTQTRIGPLQLGIIALTLATALVHIVLAIPESLVMFYLNGVGYIALVTALYLPQLRAYRRLTRYALMAFAAVTVLGWAVFGARNMVAYVDKLIELTLIGLLVVEMRRERGTSEVQTTVQS